jgi:hypothetical protein
MALWTRQTADDSTDYQNAVWAYYRYYPSEAAAILFTILFAITTFVHLYQLIRHRTWFFIPFVIGGFCTSHSSSSQCMACPFSLSQY